MHPQRATLAGAVLIVALSASRGEAGLIPWSYEWNTHPIVLNADSPKPHGASPGGIHLIPGAITITGSPDGVAHGSANITAVKLATFIFSPTSQPDRFHNTPYQLAVKLTDVHSHAFGSLHFSGAFNGTMTDSTVNLKTKFTSPRRQSLTLGHNVYTVTLTSYSPPGPPSVGSEGNISAFVDVRPAHAPEPSSLMLAGSGVVVAALCWLRRRTTIAFIAPAISLG
ncbi:MAG TPA: PEP-CTERM sorting domain-containing protein [Gemmataceae bacterium]|jgi:hypothetical protein